MAKEEKKKDDAEAKDDKKDADKKEGEGAEGEGGEGGEAAPKKSKKKLIIIGVVALLVLIGGGVGAFFAFSGSKEESAEGEAAEAEKAVSSGVYYTLPEFLVNLNSGGKQTSFLKATIVLELDSQMDVLPLEGKLPKLLDAFNTYLRELRASDLSGSAGIQRLREELLLRANKATSIEVTDVLFKEIIVQ